MKISAFEKLLLCVTAVFLLVSTGYYLGAHSNARPYRVDVQYGQSTQDLPAVAPPQVTGKLNINTATAPELEALPGVGEQRAKDIVADREKNGPFLLPEDLTRVKGIGEGTLAALIDAICTR